MALAALRERAGRRGSFFRVVPELRGDVHDLAGLAQIAAALARAGSDEGGECDGGAEKSDAKRASARSPWHGVTAPTRPSARSTRRSRARGVTRRTRSPKRSRRCARCSTRRRSRPRARRRRANPLFASAEGWIARASRGAGRRGRPRGRSRRIARRGARRRRSRAGSSAQERRRCARGAARVPGPARAALGARRAPAARGASARRRPRAPRPRRVQRVAVQG